MDLVLATHNPGKVKEVKELLPPFIRVHTLESLGFNEEIEETGQTLAENALLKAKKVWDRYSLPSIADDTGLLVEALDDAPGVYSARYAGETGNAADNIDKLLRELGDNPNRKARFETVIAYIDQEGEHLFRGVIHGEINREKSGRGGFGYDPVFRPRGAKKTFGELSRDEKNRISHRSMALVQLVTFLHNRK
jgi:XTP/dITP diphosphohydrolase